MIEFLGLIGWAMLFGGTAIFLTYYWYVPGFKEKIDDFLRRH